MTPEGSLHTNTGLVLDLREGGLRTVFSGRRGGSLLSIS